MTDSGIAGVMKALGDAHTGKAPSIGRAPTLGAPTR